MSKHPEVLWAQRSSTSASEKNIIYLTVNVPDVVESSLEYALTPTALSFKATAGAEQIKYAFDLDLYAEVDPEKSSHRLTSRSLVAVLRKKELQIEYWPRLTKEKVKTAFIKTDFSKWVDEDEQDGIPTNLDDEFGGVGGIPGMDDGMDFAKMMQQANSNSNFDGGSAPGSSDPVESDSDEDGPPPLEDAEPAA